MKRGQLPAALHARLLAGRILHSGGEWPTTLVFERNRPAFALDRLSLKLLEEIAEGRAPYLALLRRELRVAPGHDPVRALAARLSPGQPGERPPSRAPAVVRLRRALRALEEGAAPPADADQFAADLAFLGLFAPGPVLDRAGLERLAADVFTPNRGRRSAAGRSAPLRFPAAKGRR